MNYYAPLVDQVRDAPDRDFIVPLREEHHDGPNSSFLPGTQLQTVWDSVSLGLLRSCLRKYSFKMLQGWDWKERPVTLQYGAHLHTCLETYHKCCAHGLEHDVALLRCVRLAGLLGETLPGGDSRRTKETLVRAVVWYLDQYKDDPLKTALLPDGRPAVELSFMLPIFDLQVGPTDELPPLEVDDGESADITELRKLVKGGRNKYGKLVFKYPGSWYCATLEKDFYTITIYLAGHIDRVAHLGSEVFVCDYKTSKYALDSEWLKSFQPSNQFLLYYTAAQILESQPNTVFPAPPAGVLVDGIQVAVNFNRFSRFPLRYTPADAEQFLQDFAALVRLKAAGAAALGEWPAESDTACHEYRGCEFLSVCTKSRPQWDRELKQGFTKGCWDPSRPR